MDLQRLLTIREVDHRDPVEMARWRRAQIEALQEALGWDGLLEAAVSSRDRRTGAMTRRGVPSVAVDDGGQVDNSGAAQ